MFKSIQRRYFQGRIIDINIWAEKIKSVCEKWLIKTPTLSATDNNSFGFKSKDNNRRKSIQVWQTGSLYLALKEIDPQNVILNRSKRIIAEEYACDKITDSDYGLLCFALNDSRSIDLLSEKMIDYINTCKTKNDIIFYKSTVKGVAFVDTLGFVCPFLTKYGIINNDSYYIGLSKKQIENYFENGLEKHCELPFHAYNIDDGTYRGICDWARGLAWLLIALMDSYLCLRDSDVEDEFYCEKIVKYADILCKLQKQSGAYSWQLLSPNKDSDSSATAVFGWYLANCYLLFKNKKYLDVAVKIKEYLRSVTFNNGIIDYCQGDTISIGIYSRSFDKMPFAQAFALRMQNVLKIYE